MISRSGVERSKNAKFDTICLFLFIIANGYHDDIIKHRKSTINNRIKQMNYTLASTYGSGSYDSSNYNGTTTTSSNNSTTSSSTHGSVLTDTGIVLAAVVTVACLIVLAALVVRIWKRPTTKAKE